MNTLKLHFVLTAIWNVKTTLLPYLHFPSVVHSRALLDAVMTQLPLWRGPQGTIKLM